MAGEKYVKSKNRGEQDMLRSMLVIIMTITFFLLIAIISTGILLAFTLGDTVKHRAAYSADHRSSGESGDDSEGWTAYAAPVQEQVGPLLVLPHPAPEHVHAPDSAVSGVAKLPKTGTTRRPGMTFCVVGENFVTPEVLSLTFCDYAVYPDLVAEDGHFLPLYGNKSWKAFKKAIAFNRNMAVGLSFSISGVGKEHSTVAAIPHMGKQLMELAYTMNVSAMGVLNFPRHRGISTGTLQPMFSVMAKALTVQEHAEPTTFLGVWLHTIKDAQRFVHEVSVMTDVSMVILQTHVSESVISGGPCVSVPISMAHVNQDRLLPNFEVARQAAASLRVRGDKFRVVFSSTLGVMVYAGALLSAEPSSAFKPCEKASMVDSDFTCRHNMSHKEEICDEYGMYSYFSYQSAGRSYFVTLETSHSLQEKMNLYIEDVSEGWALFEVQRDVWKPCGREKDYVRLEAVQQKARLRVP